MFKIIVKTQDNKVGIYFDKVLPDKFLYKRELFNEEKENALFIFNNFGNKIVAYLK